MPASFRVEGDGTITIIYEYNADADKVSQTIGDASLYEYVVGDNRIPWVVDAEGERVPYDELTNQQKLNITFHRIKWLLLDEARAAYVGNAVDTARSTAEAEVDGIHIPTDTQAV